MNHQLTDIDRARAGRLAYQGATTPDIAAMIGVSAKTIASCCGKLLRRKRAERRQALREEQFRLALDGNTTMLAWLGKVELGQSDKPTSPKTEIVVSYENREIESSDANPASEPEVDPG